MQGNASTIQTTKQLLETSRIGDRFDAQIQQAASLAERLTTIASRIMGSAPEPLTGAKDSGPTPIPSFIRATDQRFDTMSAELERISAAVNRLEQFA
jgi:hypothetical protein